MVKENFEKDKDADNLLSVAGKGKPQATTRPHKDRDKERGNSITHKLQATETSGQKGQARDDTTGHAKASKTRPESGVSKHTLDLSSINEARGKSQTNSISAPADGQKRSARSSRQIQNQGGAAKDKELVVKRKQSFISSKTGSKKQSLSGLHPPAPPPTTAAGTPATRTAATSVDEDSTSVSSTLRHKQGGKKKGHHKGEEKEEEDDDDDDEEKDVKTEVGSKGKSKRWHSKSYKSSGFNASSDLTSILNNTYKDNEKHVKLRDSKDKLREHDPDCQDTVDDTADDDETAEDEEPEEEDEDEQQQQQPNNKYRYAGDDDEMLGEDSFFTKDYAYGDEWGGEDWPTSRPFGPYPPGQGQDRILDEAHNYNLVGLPLSAQERLLMELRRASRGVTFSHVHAGDHLTHEASREIYNGMQIKTFGDLLEAKARRPRRLDAYCLGRGLMEPPLDIVDPQVVSKPGLKEYVVEGYTTFHDKIREIDEQNGQNEQIICVFTADLVRRNKKTWSEDCNLIEAAVSFLCRYLEPSGYLLWVRCGSQKSWKDPENPFRTDRRIMLKSLPTIKIWRTEKRLAGSRLFHLDNITVMIED